jgi:hypothetical protein
MVEPSSSALPVLATRGPLLDEKSARGSLQMYRPAPGMLVTRATGHMDVVLAEGWVRCTAPLWREGVKVTVFNEWERMSGYESASRKLLTDWVIEHRELFEGAWFCTGSRLVAMGVAASGALTALAGVPMRACADRAEFDRRLRARLGSSPRPM